jgi:hypothetical protein
MADEKVSIGTILILRDEFERIVCDANKLDGIRHRARTMLALLDELLRYREKEGK